MANSAAFIKESIWRDKDFRALPRTAQATYSQLLSQKELDRAGMLPLRMSYWVKGCDEITEGGLSDDLKLLEGRRFIFVDEDTEEVFIRSYMRHSEVTKYPQYMKAALRCGAMVASEKLRHELAVELRRLHRSEASALADQIDSQPTVREPSLNGFGTVPEPFENPSGTVNPSGTLSEPSVVRERVGVVTSVGGSVGGARAREPEPTEPDQPADEPPPRFCPAHPDGTEKPCRACGSQGQVLRDWNHAKAAAERNAVRAEQYRAATDAALAREQCGLCDEDGYRNGMPCDHVDRTETAAAGMAAVRAALAKNGDES